MHAQDPRLVFMMAIPGSGKSRTVMSACQRVRARQIRFKYLDVITDEVRRSITSGTREGVQSYEDWKQRLTPLILNPLLKQLDEVHDEFCVLHIDDAQTLMGKKLVSREQWDEAVAKNEACDAMDLVMPTACSVFQALLNEHKNLRCVVSGTNFFAPLVVSVGSVAKTTHIPIDGKFPPQWVWENLVVKYFRIPDALNEAMREHIGHLSGNRRAIQHFFEALKVAVMHKRQGDEFSIEELRQVRDDAFSRWSDPILGALGASNRDAVILALAAIMFPEAYDGVRRGETIHFQCGRLPPAVEAFGLAGGLNLNVSHQGVSICNPQGCVWGFMGSLVENVAARRNVEQVKAFVNVAQSVQIEKGHAFERLVACELSLLWPRDGLGPLYSRIVSVWRGEGQLVPDPLVFGQPWVYESCIRDHVWSPHQVYCVTDMARDKGARVVDVGFPILRVDGDGKHPMRVMCELKMGYTEARLWRMCWTYFETMMHTSADVIVCFMASTHFSSSQPKDRQVSKGLSAHDSRAKCVKLMESNPRFIIVDHVAAHSRFPLDEISSIDVEQLPIAAALADQNQGMYLGTPSKQGNH